MNQLLEDDDYRPESVELVLLPLVFNYFVFRLIFNRHIKMYNFNIVMWALWDIPTQVHCMFKSG
jgi:hypothetical protein